MLVHGHRHRSKASRKHTPVKHLWKSSSRKRKRLIKSVSHKRPAKRRRVASNLLKDLLTLKTQPFAFAMYFVIMFGILTDIHRSYAIDY